MSVSIGLAQRAFKTLLATCLGHQGLTIPKWTLLGYLYRNGSTRPFEAARKLGMKPPYIAKLLPQLESEGLIVMVNFADDGRGKSISLSAEGRKLVEQVEVMLIRCINDQLKDVSQDDIRTYFEMTQYISNNVKHHE